ncbi:MAG: radical SAM protein [miscellaneous Crenarchaeota group-6 archaeon AD8-1]|nr:MAG: radical SAM protein [miscellaneous Crenarchaeota group-6 archaeon AD8-1]
MARITAKPSYFDLHKTGEMDKRIKSLYKFLENCELCPRKCKVNRIRGEKGFCVMGRDLQVSSYGPHFGEESPLVGIFGSGTIFLTGCNLLCVYCQNYEISHYKLGKSINEKILADFMLTLQKDGCHNINLVTPTHFAPQLVKSISIGSEKGLKIPIVWNCGGYESVEIIKLLDGIVDIYLPDIKYGRKDSAEKYSNASDYFERCKESVEEMYRQVGNLKVDHQGIAYKGLLVRHLVLPENQSGSKEVLDFLRSISKDVYVNIMDQYRPLGKACFHKELDRGITAEEYRNVISYAKKIGLERLDKN